MKITVIHHKLKILQFFKCSLLIFHPMLLCAYLCCLMSLCNSEMFHFHTVKSVNLFLLNYPSRAAITKYHILGGLNSRNLFTHSSGGWKLKINVPAGLASLEPFLLSLQMADFLLCPHMAFTLCEYIL